MLPQRRPLDLIGHTLARAGRDLARLAVPVSCPGCGMRDVIWCEECEAPWWERPLRSESTAPRLDVTGSPPLPVWSIAELVGPNHAMVSAWKDAGRRDLDRFFADAMRRAAEAIAPGLGGPIAVVPVPARVRSTRARGVDLPLLLAEAAAQGLRDAGGQAHVAPALRIGAGEQRGAGDRGRWRHAASVHATRKTWSPMRALLVDDVVTTGATISASARALEVTFLTVAAGLCLATTPASGAQGVHKVG